MHSRTHTNEQEHCEFLENMHQESTTNQTRWHTHEQQIVVWRRLGAMCGGLGAQRAQKPTQMHFRMWKPCSWLTLGGCFLVQFVLFFAFVFVVFSSLRPERYFIDFYAILKACSTQFVEFLDQGGSSIFSNLFKQSHDFQGSRASMFQYFLQPFPNSIPDLIFIVFLVILGSPRLPSWSLWAWFFDIKKGVEKGCASVPG